MSQLKVNELVAQSDPADPINLPVAPMIEGVRYVQVSRRNFIVNGAMAISQENGDTDDSSGSVIYIADEWQNSKGGTTGTVRRQRLINASDSTIKLTATVGEGTFAAAAFNYGFRSNIEAQNIAHLNGKDVTISFKARVNWTGNLAVSLYNPIGARGYTVDYPVISGDNRVEVTIPLEATTIGANNNTNGLELIIGGQSGTNFTAALPETWQAGLTLVTANSTLWMETSGNFVEITQVQLEQGSSATPFEHLKYSKYLAECQRYFQKYFGYATRRWVGFMNSTVNCYLTSAIPTMRDDPIISSSGAFQLVMAGTDIAITSLTATSSRDDMVMLVVTVSSGLTAGLGCILTTTSASDSNYITLDARL